MQLTRDWHCGQHISKCQQTTVLLQVGYDDCCVQKAKALSSPFLSDMARACLEDMHVFQQTVYIYEDDSTHRLLQKKESRGSVKE